jgi:hypothetical protein
LYVLIIKTNGDEFLLLIISKDLKIMSLYYIYNNNNLKMDKTSDQYLIQKYLAEKEKRKISNKKWQETHKGEAKLYYELNKQKINLRSTELRRQKNNAKKVLKLAEAEAEKEKESIL